MHTGNGLYATPRLLKYIEDYAVQYTERFTEDVPSIPDEEVMEPDMQLTKNEEAIAFGDWLRECRERSNPKITQKQLAEIVGYSRGYLAIIETGQRYAWSGVTCGIDQFVRWAVGC